ncbi:MAG: hypothetical protein R3264_12515, partial [Anaerolineae bacterium]|nr:hypothetical protein [Anaerolineae bacterium]
DEKFLIELLQLHFEHQRKLAVFVGKTNLSYFELDLLSLVLDAIGVPADNSLEQIGRYGYGHWLDQPDTFSRYEHYREFEKRVKQGTEAECRAYLENIILTTTFHHLLNGSRLNTLYR